jgi:hypothetical protein
VTLYYYNDVSHYYDTLKLLRHFGIYEAGLRFGAFVSSRSRFSVRWR